MHYVQIWITLGTFATNAMTKGHKLYIYFEVRANQTKPVKQRQSQSLRSQTEIISISKPRRHLSFKDGRNISAAMGECFNTLVAPGFHLATTEN